MRLLPPSGLLHSQVCSAPPGSAALWLEYCQPSADTPETYTLLSLTHIDAQQ